MNGAGFHARSIGSPCDSAATNVCNDDDRIVDNPTKTSVDENVSDERLTVTGVAIVICQRAFCGAPCVLTGITNSGTRATRPPICCAATWTADSGELGNSP